MKDLKLVLKMALAIVLAVFGLSAAAQKAAEKPNLYQLWAGDSVQSSKDIPLLKNVKFKTIKKYEPEVDGYKFMHGVALVRFNNGWVASFAHNKGLENTGTEMANAIFGDDTGDKWGSLLAIDTAKNSVAISHGVFAAHGDKLWAFQGSFVNKLELVHTRAYLYNLEGKKWEYKGIVAEDGFWPMQSPVKMANGSWIMAGISVGGRDQPAVAICKNNKFTTWEVKRIPSPTKVWGESAIIVDGNKVILISRSGKTTPKIGNFPHPLAYVAVSDDYGITWSDLKPSNLPMTGSKPYAGTLSNGQRYLINTIAADAGNSRTPLTIAVSKPGENQFCKLYRICDVKPGQFRSRARFSYPYAVEYKGSLWWCILSLQMINMAQTTIRPNWQLFLWQS